MKSLPALFLGCSILCSVAADAPLHVARTVDIPNSKGGFDYLQVDNDARRLLLDHTGNGTLDIIDLANDTFLKEIKTGVAQGVAIDQEHHRYFVSVSREKKLVIIDSTSLEKTGEVPLDGPGDSLAYDFKHNRVYVGHDDATDLWAIDPDAKKVEKAIHIAEGPEYVIYDPQGDRLFQNIKSDHTLVVIDAAQQSVKATWPTLPAKNPHGLVFDAQTKRLFVAGANGKLAVLSATDGKVLGSADMVNGVDQIAFDPAEKRIYCPSSGGKMSVMETTTEGVRRVGDVAMPKGAKTVAVDPRTHAVWIAYAADGKAYAQKLQR